MVVRCERRQDHRHPIFRMPYEVSNNPVFVPHKAFTTNLKPACASQACTAIYDGLLDELLFIASVFIVRNTLYNIPHDLFGKLDHFKCTLIEWKLLMGCREN